METPKLIRALYEYRANDEDELSLDEDEVLFLLEPKGDWWHAIRVGLDTEASLVKQVGWIPSNYVQEAEYAGIAKSEKGASMLVLNMSSYEKDPCPRFLPAGSYV